MSPSRNIGTIGKLLARRSAQALFPGNPTHDEIGMDF